MPVNIFPLINAGKTCWPSGVITGLLPMEKLHTWICQVLAGIITTGPAEDSNKTGTEAGVYYILSQNTGEIFQKMVSGALYYSAIYIRYQNTRETILGIGTRQREQGCELSSIKFPGQ